FINGKIGIRFKSADEFSAFLSTLNDTVTKPTKEYEYARISRRSQDAGLLREKAARARKFSRWFLRHYKDSFGCDSAYRFCAECFVRLTHLQPYNEAHKRTGCLLLNFVLLNSVDHYCVLDINIAHRYFMISDDIAFLLGAELALPLRIIRENRLIKQFAVFLSQNSQQACSASSALGSLSLRKPRIADEIKGNYFVCGSYSGFWYVENSMAYTCKACALAVFVDNEQQIYLGHIHYSSLKEKTLFSDWKKYVGFMVAKRTIFRPDTRVLIAHRDSRRLFAGEVKEFFRLSGLRMITIDPAPANKKIEDMTLSVWPQAREVLVQYEEKVSPADYRIVQENLYKINEAGFTLVAVNNFSSSPAAAPDSKARVIIFDMGGTLYDDKLLKNNKEFAVSWASQQLNGELSKGEIRAVMARLGSMSKMLRYFKLSLKEYFSALSVAVNPGKFLEKDRQLRDVLLMLVNQGHILTVVTNNGRVFTQNALKALGIFDLFSCVITQEDALDQGRRGKPDIWMFEEIRRRLIFNPLEAVSVGDRQVDIVAARLAGIGQGVLVSGRDELVACIEGKIAGLSSSPLEAVISGSSASWPLATLASYIGKISPYIHRYAAEANTEFSRLLYPFTCHLINRLLARVLSDRFSSYSKVETYEAAYLGGLKAERAPRPFLYHYFIILTDKGTGTRYYVSICDTIFDILGNRYSGSITDENSGFAASRDLIEYALGSKPVIFRITDDLYSDELLQSYLNFPDSIERVYLPSLDNFSRGFFNSHRYSQSLASSPLGLDWEYAKQHQDKWSRIWQVIKLPQSEFMSRLLAQNLFKHGDRVLSLGCGRREDEIILARDIGCFVTATDISPVCIDKLSKEAARQGISHRLIARVQDLLKTFNFPAGVFDSAIANCSLISFDDK
ncbi:MAG: HAD hydrolase-like protein, partial [Candidatus Omnitrophota bacterium]